MRNTKWLALLVGLLACGLIAAGCGDDDSTSSDSSAATEESTSEDTAAEDTTEEDSGSEVDSDGVYEACVDVFAGTAAEAQAEVACEEARTAFEECADQATAAGGDPEVALAACEDAAEQTIAALEQSGG